MMLLLNVVFVLVAIAMIALILMQRGAGAQAGSGFGGGASATVFGARGASNFLTKATKWLAIVFFGITLFMAWYATHSAKPKAAVEQDLGVMSQVAVPKAEPSTPVAPSLSPSAPVPSAPTGTAPAPATPVPAAPAPAQPQATTPVEPAKTGG
ncbi:MAG: preprotein translocase subunit SecG [Lysobacter sp.]|nr:preprotein translocase subunit SecG [Lysobacter sp.]